MVEMKCEHCGEVLFFDEDSNEARGIFHVYCRDKDCEDLSVWASSDDE